MSDDPRTVPVNLRVSPRFRAWLAQERRRQNRTTREVLDTLAQEFVIARVSSENGTKEVTPWPLD